MSNESTRPAPAALLAIGGSLLGLAFGIVSTTDFAAHLDRKVHGVTCSFVPGLLSSEGGANACATALYSPYSSLFRRAVWGGVPISLFALGAFAFFLGMGVWLWRAGVTGIPRSVRLAYGGLGLTPALVSILMFTISMTKLGAVCKVCSGIYIASFLVAASAAIVLKGALEEAPSGPPVLAAGAALAVLLGAMTFSPAAVYAATVPDFGTYVGGCGKLEKGEEKHGALLHLPTATPKKKALMFVDPLCPTCKAFHEQLSSEGIFDRLDPTVSLFPLDGSCNWMIDAERPVHPGACVVARAVICGEASQESRAILEWAYEHQPELTAAGKESPAKVKALVAARFAKVSSCIDDAKTERRLHQMLQFAVENHIRVSTPQFYLDGQRLCDEDSDLGLSYALRRLAPEVLP